MKLHEKLSDIQIRLKSKKDQTGEKIKYKYRKAEDILEAVKPFLNRHKVYLTITEDLANVGMLNPVVVKSKDKWGEKEVIFANENTIIKSTATISDGVEYISANSIVGVELIVAGMSLPQRFGSASSYGKKYALGNLFLIDDSELDPDCQQESSPKILSEKAIAKACEGIKSGTSTVEAGITWAKDQGYANVDEVIKRFKAC